MLTSFPLLLLHPSPFHILLSPLFPPTLMMVCSLSSLVHYRTLILSPGHLIIKQYSYLSISSSSFSCTPPLHHYLYSLPLKVILKLPFISLFTLSLLVLEVADLYCTFFQFQTSLIKYLSPIIAFFVSLIFFTSAFLFPPFLCHLTLHTLLPRIDSFLISPSKGTANLYITQFPSTKIPLPPPGLPVSVVF